MTTSSRRRDFLCAAVSALTSAGLPTALGSTAWGNAFITPNPSQESVVTQSDVDGLRLGRVSAQECPGETVVVPFSGGSEESISAGGVALDLFRYDSDGQSMTVYHLVLPWEDIAAGLCLRSAVSYRTRVLLHPETGELTTRIILDRRSWVTVARENSQIAVMVG